MISEFLILFFIFSNAQAATTVPQGFPAAWNGDRYYHAPCDVIKKPPSWLDGYLFCQLSASYGDPNSPAGQHVDHMFDAIGGLAVFDVEPEQSKFTGAYYPSRAFKIWNFYDRDMSRSMISWRSIFSESNESLAELWDKLWPEWSK